MKSKKLIIGAAVCVGLVITIFIPIKVKESICSVIGLNYLQD